jgi:3-oxoacyl-[acyl-carrier protein] reductase
MKLGLEGKRALVCGSSAGLGLAIAEALAGEGAELLLCARSPERLGAAAAGIRKAFGVEVSFLPADLTSESGVASVLAWAHEGGKSVDILVTNTGGPPSGPFESFDRKDWTMATEGLLLSVADLIRGVLPAMRSRGWGRIVNVTSISVKQPVEGLILSNSLRAAVTGLARTVANEVARDGITVNNVLPGYTRTERLDALASAGAARAGTTPESVRAGWEAAIPAGRLGEPAELAALTAFLCSEQAGYITGQSIAVDGGWIRGLI